MCVSIYAVVKIWSGSKKWIKVVLRQERILVLDFMLTTVHKYTHIFWGGQFFLFWMRLIAIDLLTALYFIFVFEKCLLRPRQHLIDKKKYSKNNKYYYSLK